jgi:ParB/RepB/Spo0J family partition protein
MPQPKEDVRSRAGLRDHQPDAPLRPAVVAEEVLVNLDAIDLEDDRYAMRLRVEATDLATELAADGQINAVHLEGSSPGRYRILAGFRRITAARSLGWTEIRAVVHHNLSAEEAWRLAWKDNAERRSLKQADRWWVVGRLLAAGRNQKTVAALLGVSPPTVSRDAAWLRLPASVRNLVGEHGFTIGHALALVPGLSAHPGVDVEPLLRAYRQDPCNVSDFERRVRAFYRRTAPRRPSGVRMDAMSLRINEQKLDLEALGEEEARGLLARLEGLKGRIEGWLAGRG